MSTITEIPLSQLVASPDNVRKTGGMSIDDLAASISAMGLIQNLTVRETTKGKKVAFAVIAGGRRFTALQRLLKEGGTILGVVVTGEYAIPCRVLAGDKDAKEISLAENVVREAMHPADQFAAFKALADQGMSEGDIAARFGISDLLVAQRLKLGSVEPAILQAYRDDKLNLEAVMAFTLTDDQAQQKKLFNTLTKGGGLAAYNIKRHLTEKKVSTDDRRVIFIGLDAYRAAGGTFTNDLFSTDGGGFIDRPELLDSLVTDRLEEEAAKHRKGKWKWVEAHMQMPYEYGSGYQTLHRKLTAEEQAACGVLIGLDHNGKLAVRKGVLRKGDKLPKEGGTAKEAAAADTNGPRF